jgi:hypothetical protein
LEFSNPDIYGFIRAHQDTSLAVVLNFSNTNQAKLALPGEVIISTHNNSLLNTLLPGEGKIIKL